MDQFPIPPSRTVTTAATTTGAIARAATTVKAPPASLTAAQLAAAIKAGLIAQGRQVPVAYAAHVF